MGFLGNNPDVKYYGNNKALARVSLATNESYKDKNGEWVNDTQWHNLVLWGKQAFFAEKHLSKGSEVAIEGKLINRSYQDKEGITRYITEVVVKEVHSFSRKAMSN